MHALTYVSISKADQFEQALDYLGNPESGQFGPKGVLELTPRRYLDGVEGIYKYIFYGGMSEQDVFERSDSGFVSHESLDESLMRTITGVQPGNLRDYSPVTKVLTLPYSEQAKKESPLIGTIYPFIPAETDQIQQVVEELNNAVNLVFGKLLQEDWSIKRILL